jgi:hypothetical protein
VVAVLPLNKNLLNFDCKKYHLTKYQTIQLIKMELMTSWILKYNFSEAISTLINAPNAVLINNTKMIVIKVGIPSQPKREALKKVIVVSAEVRTIEALLKLKILALNKINIPIPEIMFNDHQSKVPSKTFTFFF